MIKKLLPAMIGVALVGGMNAASADVSVVGHIDTSVVYFDNGGNLPNDSDTRFVCTTCSVGFKGSEDLGNGLKANFFLDFQFDTTDTVFNRDDLDQNGSPATQSQNTVKDRDQWVGLSGGFGEVRVGTISTLYKSHGAAIDPLYRTVVQGRDVGLQTSSFHSGAGEELEGRATNTIRYDSPSFAGVKFGAHYTLDSNEADGEDDNPYGLGVSYENGGALVFADYMDNAQSGNAEDSVWKVGGKYGFGDFTAYGQYESEDYSLGDFTNWFLAGSYGFADNLIYLGYGEQEDEPNGGGDTKSKTWDLVGAHSFSKSTLVYAGYLNIDPDASDSIDVWTVGMKHTF